MTGVQTCALPIYIVISAPGGGADGNIGAIVTDLTLYGIYPNDKEELVAYLSLKSGGTVTFFNVGVKKVLPTDEIKKGFIENTNGLALLDIFGIKQALFCDTFNGKLAEGHKIDVWHQMSGTQQAKLKKLLESGIGWGFHVIHKLPSECKSIAIDKKYMVAAATPTSCVLYYGGKTGKGKRIDIEIETKKYKLKLNFRDTAGAGGYPSHLLGDFTYL